MSEKATGFLPGASSSSQELLLAPSYSVVTYSFLWMNLSLFFGVDEENWM